MKNPILKNSENLEFIENNLEELSKSIGSQEYINEYYIDVFKHKKPIFNLEVFTFGSLWFGYRRMYLASFLAPFFLHIITGLTGLIINLILMQKQVKPQYIISIAPLVGGVTSLIVVFIIAKYANYKYFLTLKIRVLTKNEKKYGKTVLGIIGGGLLGVIGIILAQLLVFLINMTIMHLRLGSI